jgi:hypothetical protein
MINIETQAQSWLVNGNSGLSNSNFIGTTNSNPLIFKTKNNEGGRLQANCTWRFGHSINTATIDSSGILSFNGTGVYRVSDNKYIFQNSTNTNIGLYFNGLDTMYEFRNNIGLPVVAINGVNGSSIFKNTINIGNQASQNILINYDEIAAKNNGQNSDLFLNHDGGNILLGSYVHDSRVGINTTAPTSTLQIKSLGNTSANSSLNIVNSSGTTLFFVRNDRRVGIGTNTPTVALDVAGDAQFSTLDGTDCDLRQTTSVTDMGWFASSSSNKIALYNYATSKSLITILGSGQMGIGTTTPNYSLDVCGTVRAKEVTVQTGWCDYVFDKNYPLKSLEEVAAYILEKKHLPNIPSASEVETNGLKIAEMNKKMMEKIEELTLYIIHQNEQIIGQGQQISQLQKRVEELESVVRN